MADKTMQEIIEAPKLPLDISSLPIRTFLDIPYCGSSPAQTLDIALPPEVDAPFPVVVFIHARGWYYSDKRNIHTGVAWNTIPLKDFALVSINYRLTTETP